MIRKLSHLFRQWRYLSDVAAARRAFQGDRAWETSERLGIPGFGTNLIRTYFPVRVPPAPSWGHGHPPHTRLGNILTPGLPQYLALAERLLSHAGPIADWPWEADPSRPELPHLDNVFYRLVDAALLFGMVIEFRPSQVFEIGSGISTKVIHQARLGAGTGTRLTSIDPAPRAEVNDLCDRVVRCCLEDAGLGWVAEVRPGDLVFFDGSHYLFPNNDTVRFYLDVLPALPPGVLVHVHDIYWPTDYPLATLNQLWSEQYLLGAWLLGGGAGLEVILPTYLLSKQGMFQPAVEQLVSHVRKVCGRDVDDRSREGYSFWMRTVG